MALAPRIAWLAPWGGLDDEKIAAALAEQLAREIAPGHVLEGKTVHCIARRDDTDDVLFAIDDGRFAEVHLTWRQSRETDPHWPSTAIFASLDEWARDSMQPLFNDLHDRNN